MCSELNIPKHNDKVTPTKIKIYGKALEEVEEYIYL